MIEINEKQILNLKIRQGIILAEYNFKKYNKYYLSDDDIYSDVIWQIIIAVMYYWEYDNVIDIICLNNKNVDTNLLNILLNLIKKETYKYGLRIIKDSNNAFLYIYIDKAYNNEVYYVDDKNKKEDIEKSLESKH